MSKIQGLDHLLRFPSLQSTGGQHQTLLRYVTLHAVHVSALAPTTNHNTVNLAEARFMNSLYPGLCG